MKPMTTAPAGLETRRASASIARASSTKQIVVTISAWSNTSSRNGKASATPQTTPTPRLRARRHLERLIDADRDAQRLGEPAGSDADLQGEARIGQEVAQRGEFRDIGRAMLREPALVAPR